MTCLGESLSLTAVPIYELIVLFTAEGSLTFVQSLPSPRMQQLCLCDRQTLKSAGKYCCQDVSRSIRPNRTLAAESSVKSAGLIDYSHSNILLSDRVDTGVISCWHDTAHFDFVDLR